MAGIAPVRYQPILLHQATGVAYTLPSDWIKLHYVSNVCGKGWFDLTLPGNFSLGLERDFKDWRMIVWRQIGESKPYIDFAGFVRSRGRTYREGERRLALSGPDYMDMLDRRIVAYPASTTYSRKGADYADDMMKEFVKENLGASATDSDRDYSDYISVQGDLSAGTSVRKGCAWQDLFSTLRGVYEMSRETAATAAFFGVVPLGTGYQMQFRTKVGQWGQDHRHPSGTDGPLVLSVAAGTMDNVEQTKDSSDEASVVYGLGEGERSDRLQVEVEDATRTAASVINRRERGYENSGTAVSATLTKQATGRLQEMEPVETFAFEIRESTSLRVGVHLDLGDRVTVEDLFGQTVDCHLAGKEVNVDEGGESIKFRPAGWP